VTESVAVVVVTYNRPGLLDTMLSGLAGQTRPADMVYLVDNGDAEATKRVLEKHTALPLHVLHTGENLGGAGGFHLGVKQAHDDGHDRIWLMDDDVVPAPECLATLLRYAEPCLAAVREDRQGNLVEKAATRFDLRNPLAIRPKQASVESVYGSRSRMPERVPIENAAFEGFMVHRRVIDEIGLPDPAYFIFYDDVDFVVRARRAGFEVVAVRDAVLVRQLDFDQQHALDTWKGFYMYRNLFVVHFRYGENLLVRLKPFLIVLAVVVLSPLRGGREEARNVTKALWSARSMRAAPGRVAGRRARRW